MVSPLPGLLGRTKGGVSEGASASRLLRFLAEVLNLAAESIKQGFYSISPLPSLLPSSGLWGQGCLAPSQLNFSR